ncbi:MAG: heavy-metal-associated domain-containing protein, partial [Candidatus Poribacteria bacterium]
MKRWWVSLAILVVLGLFISLWTQTQVLSAAKEQSKVAQTGKKASEKPSQAESDIKGIHKQLEKVKAALAKDGKYSCCINPTCDFCALTARMCPCAKNLSQNKPVCPECLAGWKSGQGVLKGVDAKNVKMAPDKMLKKLMEMKAKLISSAGAAEKASLEKVSLKVEGMYCSACETKVQSALQKIPGVKEVEVSLEKGEATVKREKGKVTIAQLIEAIKQSGYQASVKE